MSSLEVLPAFETAEDGSVNHPPSLTLLSHDDGTISFDPYVLAERPREIRSHQAALASIFASLFQPVSFDSCAQAPTELPVAGDDIDLEGYCEAIYAVAAALLGARRVAEAAKLLRQLDSMAAPGTHGREWKARSEFLWAVQAERTADSPAVLEHAAAAAPLAAAAPNVGSDGCQYPVPGLVRTVDAVASARLPLLTARAKMGLGQPDQALAILEDAYGSVDAAEAAQPVTMAMLACARGQLNDAHRLACAALGGAERNGAGTEITDLEARVVLAEVFFERNALDAAHGELLAALRSCCVTDAWPWIWTVDTLLARLSVAQLRAADAVPRLHNLRQVMTAGVLPRSLIPVLNHVEVDCRLQLDDIEGAVTIVRTSSPQELDGETIARVDLCLGRPDRVMARLGTGTAPSAGARIRRLILLACAEKQQGRPDTATCYMRKAIGIAEPQQYVRPFLEHAAPVLPLLSIMGASSRDRYLSHLISETEPIASKATTGMDGTMLEPLSEREWEVLQHLTSHHTIRQIANLMFVSPNTVKTHVKSIYRKTGAISRDDAVTIARSHGLA
ncbi:MAG TPA: LuxR C-terminal-related transcriptional regulator [Acidimicrobiales bacterium]|nr:LuxR C-terminal-related transcriptional regulator [Acidimicrobiales bacterium]